MPHLKIKSIDCFLDDLKSSSSSGAAPSTPFVALPASARSFCDLVFEIAFERQVRPVLVQPDGQQPELLPAEQRLLRGFSRWMAGQLAVCSRYHFVPESAACAKQVRASAVLIRCDLTYFQIIDRLVTLEKAGKGMTLPEVDELRAVYEVRFKSLRHLHGPAHTFLFRRPICSYWSSGASSRRTTPAPGLSFLPCLIPSMCHMIRV
jgi:hypothetical protein